MAKNEVIEQTKNFYSNLTKVQKMVILGALGVVVIGILALIITSSSGEEKAILFTSLDQNDAAQVVNKLKEKSIPYELKDNGSTILVDKKIVYETRLSLASDGLPNSSVVGYEIFDKTNLGMSEFVQKLNYRRALEGELARTITSIDEVKKVRVHLVIPDKALFEKDQNKPSASVTLHLKSGRSLSKISVDGIQNLVASSVEGMQPGSVSVVDQKGKILSAAPLDDKSPAGLTSMQHEQKRQVEQYLASKAQSLLDGVLGVGNAEVRVNADLDFTQISKSITDYDPERQVVRSEQAINESINQMDTTVNSDTGRIASVTPSSNVKKNQSNTVANYEIKKTVEQIVKEIGNVKRLSVSVLINGKHSVVTSPDGKNEMKYTPRTKEEIQKLTEIVKNAIGYDPSRNDQVSVYDYPFDNNMLDQDLDKLNEPAWYLKPDNVKLIILLLAIIITVYLIYRVLQSKQIKERFRIAFSLPEHIEVEEEIEEEIIEEAEKESLDDLEFDDDEMLLLPADLPEQLLLEGDHMEDEEEDEIEAEDETLDREALAERARAMLDEGEPIELSEEALMKLEIKERVQDFVDDQTADAVRIVRMLMAQDYEKGIF